MCSYITDYKDKLRAAQTALTSKIESGVDVINILKTIEELKSFMIQQNNIIDSLQGQLELAQTFSNPKKDETILLLEEENKRLKKSLMISKNNETLYLAEWTKAANENQKLETKIEALNLLNDSGLLQKKIRTLTEPTPVDTVQEAIDSLKDEINKATRRTSQEGIIIKRSDEPSIVNNYYGGTFNTYGRDGRLNERG